MEKINVLYADDEKEVRDLVRNFIVFSLQKSNFSNISIDTCENGVELLEKADPLRYNLYVTDHNMPKKTGLQALIELRQRGDKTPALLISGGADDLSGYADLERVAFLQKPLQLKEVTQTLANLLIK